MVAKIRLEAEDATKEAFDSILRNASNLEKALEGVSAFMEMIGDSSTSMSDKLDDSSEAMDEMSDDLDKLKSELQKVSDSQKEAASFDDLESSMEQTQAAATLLANGFTQSEVAAMSMDERLQQADTTFNALNAVLSHVTDNLIDVEHELTRVAEEEYRAAAAAGQAAHGIDRVGDEADKSSSRIHEMSSALKKSKDSSGLFHEAMSKFGDLKEIFEEIAEVVNHLADQGNPAFVRLRDSANHLFEELTRLAELEEVQIFIDTIASGFEAAAEFVSQNAENVDWLVKKYKDLVEIAVSYLEYMGLIAAGTTEELRRMKELEAEESKRYAQKLEAEKRAIQATKQQAEVDKALHDLEMERAAASEAATAKKIEDAKELARLQEEEVARVRKLASEGKATEEEVATSQRRWKLYEQQKMDLENQAADEKKKQLEDAQKKEEEWKKTAAEKSAEMAKVENEKKLQDFREYVNKLVETVEAINKQAQGPEIDIETLGGGVASRERAEKMMIQKDIEAAQDETKKKWEGKGHRNDKGEFIDQAATEKYKQLQEQAEIDLAQEFAARGDTQRSDGTFEDKGVQREYQRELNKRNAEIARENFQGQRFTSTGEVLDTWRTTAYTEDMNRAKKNALSESRKQIRSGNRDEELNRMQMDFANSFIEQEGANSNLSKANVRALKQAVEASVKNKHDTEKLAMDVEQIQRFLAENMNARRQAQRKNY